jgi:hypothetical protein
MSARSGVWLGATALTGRDVPVSGAYPHVCGKRTPNGWRMGSKGCAACGERDAPEVSDLDEQFAGQHNCEPAGRGTQTETWTCPTCGQRWERTEKIKAGSTFVTWRRSDG